MSAAIGSIPRNLPALVALVSRSLATLDKAAEATASLPPAVPIRRSQTDEYLTCLDCGRWAKILKRHLMTAHGRTVADYRARWGLASDYPMVARNYRARRSQLAKSLGLGRHHEVVQ